MPPKKGTKSKGRGKAKAATLEPAQEVTVQEVDMVDEKEIPKHTFMEVDSAPVEGVMGEDPVLEATTSEAKPGITPQERAQKLAALRAKMVGRYQFPCTDEVGC
jgi:hypothetical protein